MLATWAGGLPWIEKIWEIVAVNCEWLMEQWFQRELTALFISWEPPLQIRMRLIHRYFFKLLFYFPEFRYNEFSFWHKDSIHSIHTPLTANAVILDTLGRLWSYLFNFLPFFFFIEYTQWSLRRNVLRNEFFSMNKQWFFKFWPNSRRRSVLLIELCFRY